MPVWCWFRAHCGHHVIGWRDCPAGSHSLFSKFTPWGAVKASLKPVPPSSALLAATVSHGSQAVFTQTAVTGTPGLGGSRVKFDRDSFRHSRKPCDLATLRPWRPCESYGSRVLLPIPAGCAEAEPVAHLNSRAVPAEEVARHRPASRKTNPQIRLADSYMQLVLPLDFHATTQGSMSRPGDGYVPVTPKPEVAPEPASKEAKNPPQPT